LTVPSGESASEGKGILIGSAGERWFGMSRGDEIGSAREGKSLLAFCKISTGKEFRRKVVELTAIVLALQVK
jgi:hypothetical protein